ncbi:MAG: alpha/beta hydrolase [Nibricoccus sp.]
MSLQTKTNLRHRQIEVDGLVIRVVEAGESNGADFLLLHGWPEDWSLYESLMGILSAETHVVAIDLPGIGGSETVPQSGEKRWLAARVATLIRSLGLRAVTLVGHDIGGQIVYACLRRCPEIFARAVLMNIVIPGLSPWDKVIGNPHLWHFAFHAVPKLPETLVTGNIPKYFAFFFNTLGGPRGVSEKERARYAAAYARPGALQTGFDWYRAFDQDERDNRADHSRPVQTPVLYLRGDHEHGAIEDYIDGLRRAGCAEVEGALLANCGHFAPSEQPEQVAAALRSFVLRA